MVGTASISLVTKGPDETRAVGARLAPSLFPGALVLLIGPLGAGKTCFAQGVARGLGVTEQVVSPSYVLVREYSMGAERRLVHMDFYRVSGAPEALALGLDDYLRSEDMILVEWPENIGGVLPTECLTVVIGFADDSRLYPERRRITLEAVGQAAVQALCSFESAQSEVAGT